MLGDNLEYVALAYLIGIRNGDLSVLAVVFSGSTLAQMLFYLAGGWIADRVNPLRLVIIADAAYAAATCYVAYLIHSNLIDVQHLLPPYVITGIMGGLTEPARSAAVPLLARREVLRTANQRMVLIERSSIVVGPLLSAALIGVIGVAGVYLVNASTYVVAVLATLSVAIAGGRSHSGSQSDSEAITGETKAGSLPDFLKRSAIVPALLVMSLLASGSFNGIISIGLPALAVVLGSNTVSLGLLTSSFGIGAIAGAGLSQKVRGDAIQVISACYLVMAGCLFGLAAPSPLPVAMTLLFLLGAASGVQTVWYRTALQKATPRKHMSQVISFSFSAGKGGGVVIQLVNGKLMDAFGHQSGFILSGSVILLVGVVGYLYLTNRFSQERGWNDG